jgi:hypothetical protein
LLSVVSTTATTATTTTAATTAASVPLIGHFFLAAVFDPKQKAWFSPQK